MEEQLKDGCRVRLRSRVYGNYLCADEDGKSVSLLPQCESLNATWAVHLLVREGTTSRTLLLHSAAYGRYLAASDDPAPMGLRFRGYRLAQVDFEDTDQYNIRWVPAASPSGDDVRLYNLYRRGHLCANGTTVHAGYDSCEKMDWAVETAPQGERADRHRPQTRPLLPRMLSRLLGTAQRPEEPTTRTIRFRRHIPGNSEPEEWKTMQFSGMSLNNLANKLSNLVGKGYVICVQAGCLGRLTPLVTDLPRNRDAINLVLLPSETQEVGDPASGAVVTPNGQIFEVGLGLSIADELVDLTSMPNLKKEGNFKSPETYLWHVNSGQEAEEAIRQWSDCGRPDNAVVDLSEKLVFRDVKDIVFSFEGSDCSELTKKSADYARLIREYRALVSISKLPCPPKEVAARFCDRSQKSSSVVEPWVMLNVEH